MGVEKMGKHLIPLKQKTLKTSIHCKGVGLHGGQDANLTLHPAPAGHGIIFKRVDLPEGQDNIIPASWDRVSDTMLCTTISNADGVSISTIEHLMAGLAGCEIDNVLIELDGPEVPIMDGSSEPFVLLIKTAGSVEQAAARRALKILKTVEVNDGSRMVRLSPDNEFSMSFEIDFDSAAITRKSLDIRLVNGTFNDAISPARTFGFLADVDQMRAAGLARGGSLDNAVIVDDDKILNDDGLRYDDEFVRHKILDCVGDLYLAGAQVIGRVEAVKSGHHFNNLALRALFEDEDAYEFVELSEADAVTWHDPLPMVATA